MAIPSLPNNYSKETTTAFDVNTCISSRFELVFTFVADT